MLIKATFVALALAATPSPAEVQELQQQFIDELVEKHQFDAAEVEQKLAEAQLNEDVLAAIQRPWEAKPWYQYHPIFLTDKRLDAGLRFWQKHKEDLARAEQQYGVPAEVIVAIIGVETFYGTYLGNYSVLDSLYTLGFHYPPRATFFRSELAQYFVLAREEGFDMNSLQGSYAGAMGYGQFISSSYRAYAVDFDGDGVRDLLKNPVDAIGSVANYFARHGWQPNGAVAIELTSNETHAGLIRSGLKQTETLAELQQQGLTLPADIHLTGDQAAKVYEFEQADSKDYWLGLKNFYVITRYNHSPLYAMVVHQFSQQLKHAQQ